MATRLRNPVYQGKYDETKESVRKNRLSQFPSDIATANVVLTLFLCCFSQCNEGCALSRPPAGVIPAKAGIQERGPVSLL